ncbi:hypothetical protein Q4493_17230 [Colwellia sp. 1_MG-2023]|uniref:hypothetical protein n=1 Tax=Colwellia sp. 1_MG-2023 TaxID=3062649 RepID=UPI0026E27205|nr:hypothetical protein [Colwellia sp. 1_MG-2023]MDO6447518.1 hypothetical protein [Colwellia sp. 1_MG-2023]
MKNLLTVLSVVLFASTANASNSNVKFVSLDSSVESKICILAATDGYRAAKKQADKMNNVYAFNITCNGQNIRDFSNSFKAQPVKSNVKAVFIKPANNSIESKICAQAVKTGIESVVGTTKYDVNEMVCNGLSISQFVKRYSNT